MIVRRRAAARPIAILLLGLGLGCGPAPSASAIDPAEPLPSDETFRFVPPPDAPVLAVSLRGSFNGWGETPMAKQADGSWAVTLPLVPGQHQYKYFVDGEWPLDMAQGPTGPIDPDADGYVPDGYGGRNAVRIVAAGGAPAAEPDPAAMAARMDALREGIDGASITIYPVIAGGTAVVPLAQLAALFLERCGFPGIRVTETAFNVSARSDVRQNARAFGAFVRDAGPVTGHALLGELRAGAREGTTEVRCIVVDAGGHVVWVDEQVLDAEAADPMSCIVGMVDRFRTRLGLPDPAREDAPEGVWAELWRAAGGVPPESELNAMEERRRAAREGFAQRKVWVFPVVRGREGDREAAVALAELLQEADLCQARAAGSEIVIDRVPGTNEQAMLWDLARGFREFVRRHGIDADYALLAEYFLDADAEKAHAVHFVVCDRHGDWVIVDLQNDHHDDFRSLSPGTADGCSRLVVRRMNRYLTEN